MAITNQKINTIKTVAVALVRDEDGNVLIVREPEAKLKSHKESEWVFPTSMLIPGATYTETFAAYVLEITGCIIEATALVASEKKLSAGIQLEYVSCKIICRDRPARRVSRFKWVHPTVVNSHVQGRFHRDIIDFFGV